jgi:hypothetical protein
VNQCLQDVEIGFVEEIPKMILKFEKQTMVYVYKTNDKAWLEYNPYQLTPTEHQSLIRDLGFDPKTISRQTIQASSNEECISINIENEQEFLIRNINQVIMPIDSVQNYLYYQTFL